MVLFVNFYVVFHFLIFSFNNYVSLRYIQLNLGARVLTCFRKELPAPLAICSFCGCLIVFVCFFLWC